MAQVIRPGNGPMVREGLAGHEFGCHHRNAAERSGRNLYIIVLPCPSEVVARRIVDVSGIFWPVFEGGGQGGEALISNSISPTPTSFSSLTSLCFQDADVCS